MRPPKDGESWSAGSKMWQSPMPVMDFQEEMRSIPITLPVLADPGTKNAALLAGDWLTQLEPLIGDVSARAGIWWKQVVELTMKRYREWLQAPPLQRLYIKAPADEELPKGFDRLRQRVSSMMLQAIPTAIKDEVISTRQLSPQGILFRILRVYQPGGLNERSETLKSLTATTSATTAKDAVESLRLWKRHHNRASELGASLPDSTLMIKALDRTMELLLNKSQQASFRVSTFRLQYEVDVNPNDVVVNKLYEVLLAEAELMVTANSEENPAVKQMQVLPNGKGPPQQQTSPGKMSVCKWWGSTEGCRRGRACKFLHDLDSLEDKSTRCWLCSSTTHAKKNCPTKDGQHQVGGSGGGGSTSMSTSMTTSSSNKGQFNGNKNNQQEKKGKGGGKKGKDKGKSEGTAEDKKEKDEKADPNIASMNVDDDKRSEASVRTASTGDSSLMNEVTNLLKCMRISNDGDPTVKAMVKQVVYSEEKNHRVLIDGGATHCLRRASMDEWNQSCDVTVHLATGTVKLRQHPEKKTIFTKDHCQPIVPMALLVQAGAQVAWDKDGCKIQHPVHGRLEVKMDQGCPTLEHDVGMKIMLEVEQMMMRGDFAVRMLGGVEKSEKDEEMLKKLQEVKKEFPLVPDAILNRIPGRSSYDPTQLPLNRKMRRRVQNAEKVIIHLYSGPDPKEWLKLRDEKTYVICIDKLYHNGDMLNDHLMGYLEEVMDSGKVEMFLMGPPCRTVSAARHTEDGGPRPLRSREGDERFGLKGLNHYEKKLVEDDTVLMLRAQWLARKGNKASNGIMESMLEQPRDPSEYREGSYPTFLAWPETKETADQLGWQKVILDQGAVGHPTRKPTTLLSDIPEVAQLHGLKDDRPPQHDRQKLSLEQRLEQSKSWAAWAEGLKYVLKVAAKRIKNTPTAAMKVVNLPKKEVESWRRHFAAGHVPYRRDCGVCVEAAGRGRCRKRIQHPEAFCLSVDTAGPFCAGVDQSRKKAKYMLIGTITIPTKKGRPMVEGLDRLIARDPGKDQRLDSMEEALMSLYDQYKEMENPEEDPLKIEDEKDSKEKGEDPVEVEAQEVEECVSKRSGKSRDRGDQGLVNGKSHSGDPSGKQKQEGSRRRFDMDLLKVEIDPHTCPKVAC